jgi:hypothetical protein
LIDARRRLCMRSCGGAKEQGAEQRDLHTVTVVISAAGMNQVIPGVGC